MKKVLKRIFFLIFLIFLIPCLLPSCREECHYKPRSLAGVDFHSLINGTDVNSPVDSLSVWGLGREDSLLYDLRNNVTTINLPMNGNADETGFVVIIRENTDTVWFTYEVIPWFISQECGFVLNFDLLEARHTTNMIDSVIIVAKEITSFDDTNVRIYH